MTTMMVMVLMLRRTQTPILLKTLNHDSERMPNPLETQERYVPNTRNPSCTFLLLRHGNSKFQPGIFPFGFFLVHSSAVMGFDSFDSMFDVFLRFIRMIYDVFGILSVF
jgi:hypothetical protein